MAQVHGTNASNWLDASDGVTNGADGVYGYDGKDTLFGLGGDDWLEGGKDADVLNGGTGSDVFVFAAATDSTVGAPDQIVGFEGAGPGAGDRLDFSAVDANTRVAGNQAFTVGASGTLRSIEKGGVTEILGDTNGNGIADFRLLIHDGAWDASSYSVADAIL
jgi:Ca2+-binding RTX toxin-like protein